MVVFGIGAGLRPGELAALGGSDVARRGRQVTVRVSGPAARVVPVASGYAGRAAGLARGAGDRHLYEDHRLIQKTAGQRSWTQFWHPQA